MGDIVDDVHKETKKRYPFKIMIFILGMFKENLKKNKIKISILCSASRRKAKPNG